MQKIWGARQLASLQVFTTLVPWGCGQAVCLFVPPTFLSLPPPPHIFHRLKKLRHLWTQRESNGANETRGLDFALVEDTMGLQWMISLTVKCKSWPWTLNPSAHPPLSGCGPPSLEALVSRREDGMRPGLVSLGNRKMVATKNWNRPVTTGLLFLPCPIPPPTPLILWCPGCCTMWIPQTLPWAFLETSDACGRGSLWWTRLWVHLPEEKAYANETNCGS